MEVLEGMAQVNCKKHGFAGTILEREAETPPSKPVRICLYRRRPLRVARALKNLI